MKHLHVSASINLWEARGSWGFCVHNNKKYPRPFSLRAFTEKESPSSVEEAQLVETWLIKGAPPKFSGYPSLQFQLLTQTGSQSLGLAGINLCTSEGILSLFLLVDFHVSLRAGRAGFRS